MKVQRTTTMQRSFSELEYAAKKKVTRRDRFLGEINTVMPWSALIAEIEPYYSEGEGRGRPPIGVERMLHMYIAQQCFGLSDEGVEDAIYDSQAIRGFVGIDLSHESSPDATTLLKFRRLLEEHQLTERIFAAINVHLAVKGLMLKEGMRPSRRQALPNTKLGRTDELIEKNKAKIRAKVEHSFHYVKNLFGRKKTRYWGLAKNTAQLFMLFALANLVIAKRRLFELDAQGAS